MIVGIKVRVIVVYFECSYVVIFLINLKFDKELIC